MNSYCKTIFDIGNLLITKTANGYENVYKL